MNASSEFWTFIRENWLPMLVMFIGAAFMGGLLTIVLRGIGQ